MQRVKLGVIGLGYWGPKLLHNFLRHQGFQVTAVADISPVRREWAKSNQPALQVVDDPSGVLEADMDAVVIATPVETHAELACAALESGKHCWVEKPVAATFSEAEAIVRAAADAGKIAVAGHQYLYHPGIRVMEELAISPDDHRPPIGKPFSIHIEWNNQRPPETRHDVLEDLGPHAFSILFHLFGRPESCTAAGKAYLPTGEHYLLDDVTALFSWEDGRTASLRLGWHSPQKVRRVTLFAENGMAVFNETEPVDIKGVVRPTAWFRPGVDSRVENREAPIAHSYSEGDIILPYHPPGTPLEYEIDGFHRAITLGEPVKNDIRTALLVVRAAEAVRRSIEGGMEKVELESRVDE